METRIKGIFSRNLVTIKEADNIMNADFLMNQYGIRHLPVLDKEDYLVGILSTTDYMALKRLSIDLQEYRVKDLMSAPVKTFASNTRVKSVAQLFITKKINSGLVMEGDEIAGIVTSEDLLMLLAQHKDGVDLENLDMEALAGEGWISATQLL